MPVSVASSPRSPGREYVPMDTLKRLKRLSQRHCAKGEYSEAVQCTTKCIKALQAELASLLALRAAVQLHQKEFAAAMADADNAISLNKGWYKGYLRKGAVLLAMNAPLEAAEHLETALQLCPSNAEAKRTLREAYKAIANQCYEQGHYEFSVRWCDHALEILRSESTLAEDELGQQMGLCFTNRSSANLRQGNCREALRDAELAVFNNPWWGKGWLRKGMALGMLGGLSDLEGAVDALEEGLMLDSRSVEIRGKLDEVRRKVREMAGDAQEEFDTSFSELLPTAFDPDADSRPEDVPLFHEEWARYYSRELPEDQIEAGSQILYDSYLQARNIKLHLFSLETYEWTGEEESVWHRVGASEQGLRWYHSKPAKGDVRDVGAEEWALKTTNPRKNHSFMHYPPQKMVLQIHGTVTAVFFQFQDLMQLLMSTVVYADGSSILKVVAYEHSAYSIAKVAVLTQMLLSEAPLDAVVQVWFSSGWSTQTEAIFRQACQSLTKVSANPSTLSAAERSEGASFTSNLPYEAKVILQIWSGTESITRKASLKKWRKGHSRQDLGFLAANLKRCKDRVDYCHYYLTGEILKCDVGSICMYADYSNVHTIASSESIMQALPLLPLNTAYNAELGLFPSIVGMLKRRLHIMRLRLRKKRLQFEFHMNPIPLDGTPISEPSVARALHRVQQHRARYFNWGTLLDSLGPYVIHELVERCGAQHSRNYAQSIRWGDSTYGTHLLDYDRAARSEMLESLWREAQHGVRAVGGNFLAERPFAHPFHLCNWGLGRRYMRSWSSNFFASVPMAAVHDLNCADFNPFTLFPLMLQWTPQPLKREEPGAVRSASPVTNLVTEMRERHDERIVHATTIQCHSCDQVVTLEEKENTSPRPAVTITGTGPERIDVMATVFEAGDEDDGEFDAPTSVF